MTVERVIICEGEKAWRRATAAIPIPIEEDTLADPVSTRVSLFDRRVWIDCVIWREERREGEGTGEKRRGEEVG